MQFLKKAFLVFILLLTFSYAQSQVTAEFDVVGDTVGCGYLIGVQFNNTSSGSGSLSYHWDLGNGNTSILTNPVADYPMPGVFTVELIVNNGVSWDTAYFTITVYNEPVADFISDPISGCIPLTVDFSDNSTNGDAPIDTWYWTFGDGNVSNGQTTSHEYLVPGNWNVTLLVTDTNTCTGTISHIVTVSDLPDIDIAADITNFCTVPVAITFDNIPPCTNCTYEWDFGDGGTSTNSNPVHTYTGLGLYDIILTVTNQAGCVSTDTFPDFIELNQVTASMDIPDTVCVGLLYEFYNTSGIECIWDFGDGFILPSSNASELHSYALGGYYYVTLIAGISPCFDTIIDTVFVEVAIADFTTSHHTACSVPATFYYDGSNSSSNIVSWEWHFGDGTVDSQVVPNTSNTYYDDGAFHDTLIVSTAFGCTDMLVVPNNIVIQFPDAEITADTIDGCAPLSVDFTDNSFSNETITNWNWTFPGGTPGTSTDQNPEDIIFNTDGEFTVVLEIINDSGCVSTDSIIIEVGIPITPNFYIPDSIKCADDTISFINYTDSTNVDTWDWEFSDEFEPTDYHIILDDVCSDTGYCEIMLITEYNGCRDTLIMDSTLYINGPIVHSIAPSFDCDSPYVFTFEADITDGEYWDWDFTDGTVVDSTTINPITHTYIATGWDSIYITAYNEATGCVYDTNARFLIADVQAVIGYDSIMCTGNQMFYGMNSIDASTYDWHWGDGTAVTHSLNGNHFYSNPGDYDIMLIAYDATPNHCPDTAFGHVKVAYINAGFIVDTTYGCAQSPLVVTFIDTSESDFIYSAVYDFGNGISGNLVMHDTITNSYSDIGSYNVTLTITDTIGCTDVVTYNNLISTYGVTANFHISDSSLCLGVPVQFIADSNNIYNYYWDFGNDSLSSDSTIANPWMTYLGTGYYSGQLIVEYDTLGCRDTLFVDSLLYVQNIITDISLTQSVFDCYAQTVINNSYLQNNTSTIYNPTWQWDFGDGNTSTIQNPVFNYTLPGDYWISLIATTPDPFGCVDTDSVMVTLMGPYANIYIENDTICIGEELTFSLQDSINIHSVYWGFGDGSSSTEFTATHAYQVVGQISFVLDVSEIGCPVDPIWDTLFVTEVFSAFNIYDFETGIHDTAHCSPFIVGFENLSNGATSWSWEFGDGQTFSGPDPSEHTYENAGVNDTIYSIQLAVEDVIYGCKDTVIYDILVYSDPQMTITEDKFICRGEEVNLIVTGGNTVIWTPDSIVPDQFSYNLLFAPDSTHEYFAQITDIYGCTNSGSVIVTVQQEPNVIYSPDTSIIIGETIDLWVEADQPHVSFLWSVENETVCANCGIYSDMPLQTTEYVIVYEDSARCFLPSVDILVTVIEEYSLDVPMAFTPNGDGTNDIVYVRGWGIKQLLEFNIYNRWGQKVFFTDDIKQGWDGTFNGKKQNMDTYAYYVKVLLWNGTEKDKKGTISLMR